MKYVVLALTLLALFQPASAANDAILLRDHVFRAYPSLLYVDTYRRTLQRSSRNGLHFCLATSPNSASTTLRQLIATLVELGQDPYRLPVAGGCRKSETLGLLFRTSSDGRMIVWRVFDASIRAVTGGEQVLAVDGLPTQAWLRRAASMTFGGNRRGRYAEAALDLGLGTPIVHRTAYLERTVHLVVKSASGAPRTITLAYRPMNAQRALALPHAGSNT